MTILVFDSAPLSCFARARQLSMLERLTAGDDRVTTHAVLDEIRNGIAVYPDLQGVLQLPWLRVVSGEGLAELKLFAWYAQRLGAGDHDIGEASVLAWAQAHGATPFTDDQAAYQAGREQGILPMRTLGLVCRGVRTGVLAEPEAAHLIGELHAGGARFPVPPGEFLAWARDRNLLG